MPVRLDFVARSLLTDPANAIPAQNRLSVPEKARVDWSTWLLVRISRGDPAAKGDSETVPGQANASGKPVFRSAREHRFQTQIILKLKELLSMWR